MQASPPELPCMGMSATGAATDSGTCPVCLQGPAIPFADVDGHPYFECGACGSLYIDPAVLAAMDRGESTVGCYAREYWDQERKAAMERAHGIGLCLAGEAILYCRRPVERFLDVGAGAGELLRQLQQLLDPEEIGRASCRERVEMQVVAVVRETKQRQA